MSITVVMSKRDKIVEYNKCEKQSKFSMVVRFGQSLEFVKREMMEYSMIVPRTDTGAPR